MTCSAGCPPADVLLINDSEDVVSLGAIQCENKCFLAYTTYANLK